MSTSLSPGDRLPDNELHTRYQRRAVQEIGECLSSLGTVLQQPVASQDGGRLGSIAAGLMRAASYVQGKPYTPVVDESHANPTDAKTGAE
jgi:hypothetical protein